MNFDSFMAFSFLLNVQVGVTRSGVIDRHLRHRGVFKKICPMDTDYHERIDMSISKEATVKKMSRGIGLAVPTLKMIANVNNSGQAGVHNDNDNNMFSTATGSLP